MSVRVALLGFGTVGRAFAARAVDDPRLRVVSVTDRSGTVRDASGVDLARVLDAKARGAPLPGARALPVTDAAAAGHADVVVDALPTDFTTGGASVDVAHAAFRAGRHVVTAAKGPLALHGARVRSAARAAGVTYRGSATVSAGTPVLELAASGFRGDDLRGFEAVLNGSTSFLLSRLEEGAEWHDALRDAREHCYLEADPSLDILGHDAAAKAVILANHAWDAGLTLADARVTGVLGVTPAEAREARASGFAIRLVARATPAEGVRVAPVTLPRGHALATEGAGNAVRFRFRDAGDVTITGPGAGGRETAAALVSDVLALSATEAPSLPAMTHA